MERTVMGICGWSKKFLQIQQIDTDGLTSKRNKTKDRSRPTYKPLKLNNQHPSLS